MPDTEAYGYLETIRVGETVELLIAAEALAKEESPTLAIRIHRIAIGLLEDVNRAAVEMAGLSEGAIIKHIFSTRHAQRPLTGEMETHIVSKPGPLGQVEVALIAELDKIINPQGGYDSFWRAQEYGTGADSPWGEIPSQVGRLLPQGRFEPSGTAPDPQQRGLGAGRDIAFVADRGAQGASAARISVDLPARHFLRDGFAEAVVAYQAAMTRIQGKWNIEIEKCIVELGHLRSSGGAFRGLIIA